MIIRRIRLQIGYILCILFIGLIAVAGAVGLGRFYLKIVREGSIPRYTKVTADGAKSVAAGDQYKMVMLTPIPVYFLQAGVYSDVAGARDAAGSLEEAGYTPYITESNPHKIWLGVYLERSDTELVKQQLKDKGVGSFTASIVINGVNLRYGRGSENFVKQITPVLEVYTSWVKENLQVFHSDNVKRLNWPVIEKQAAVAAEVYKEVQQVGSELKSNHEGINRSFAALGAAMEEYHEQFDGFMKKKDQKTYEMMQYRLLRFIDKYQQLWQEIDNVSKT